MILQDNSNKKCTTQPRLLFSRREWAAPVFSLHGLIATIIQYFRTRKRAIGVFFVFRQRILSAPIQSGKA